MTSCPSLIQFSTRLIYCRISHIPLLPVTIILNLPVVLPRAVNGRLLGILILGMINCGALSRSELSCKADDMSGSSSSLDAIAWLWTSSITEPSSDFRRDRGLLGRDAVPDEVNSGVWGVDVGCAESVALFARDLGLGLLRSEDLIADILFRDAADAFSSFLLRAEARASAASAVISWESCEIGPVGWLFEGPVCPSFSAFDPRRRKKLTGVALRGSGEGAGC